MKKMAIYVSLLTFPPFLSSSRVRSAHLLITYCKEEEEEKEGRKGRRKIGREERIVGFLLPFPPFLSHICLERVREA